jgi:hypothetical protein
VFAATRLRADERVICVLFPEETVVFYERTYSLQTKSGIQTTSSLMGLEAFTPEVKLLECEENYCHPVRKVLTLGTGTKP